jgi:predicted GNAT family acetyltransferase
MPAEDSRSDRPVADPPPLRFADAPDDERYEARAEDGELMAVITYRLGTRWIALLHTEVRPEFEGRGIASRFVAWAFEDARARGLKVVPNCPYVRTWLPRHPEVHDVLLRASDAQPEPKPEESEPEESEPEESEPEESEPA